MIRAFIAFDLKNQATLNKIEEFKTRLKTNQQRLKVVEFQNLHLTVKFLGNVQESLVPKIYKILHEEINEYLFKGENYEFQLKGVGQFNQYSVIWIKLHGDLEFLQNIKNSVENLLFSKLKIEKDKRMKFKPHLTIGRLRKNKINYRTLNTFKNLIKENKDLKFGVFNISEIHLKKSDLTSKGPKYTNYTINGFQNTNRDI